MTTTADNNAAADLLAVQRDLHAQALGAVQRAVSEIQIAERALRKTKDEARSRIEAATAAATAPIAVRDQAIVVAATLGIPTGLIAEAAGVSVSTVSNLIARAKKIGNGAVTDKEAES
jgi:DNA-directed RNA polymerase specialized sigma24 family protein